MIHKTLKIVCLGILVLLLGVPSLAQNTKGDKPAPSNRESRFKTPKKPKQKIKPARKPRQKGDQPSKRVSLRPTKTRGGERPGKPILPAFSRSKPSDKQKPWRGDITGRRIRARAPGKSARNVYPQPPSINYSSTEKRRAKITGSNNQVFTRRPSGRAQDRPGKRSPRIIPRSASSQHRNVYSQKSFYVNNKSNKSNKPPRYQNEANRFALRVIKGYPGLQKPRVKDRKVVPRSASAAFMARRSTNTWAHFPRPKKKKERAYTRDLAGKKLRTKNFETQRPVLINPTHRYQKRMAAGERPYRGPAAGGYISRPPKRERAWKGDVARWPLRGGKPRGGQKAGIPLFGKAPGIGARGIGKYQGDIKGKQKRGFENQGEEYSGNVPLRRRLKGGGSVSARGWNNKGFPIQGKTPGKGAVGIGYSGNIRGGKKGFNNQGEEYTGNIRAKGKRGFTNQGEEYSGNIRAKDRRGFNNQGEEYSGNIRSKGRRGFNNQGEEYTGNIRTLGKQRFGDQGEEYTGNIKARRPDKGGGSRSGILWNNKNTPILVRIPPGKSARIASYQGNLRAGRKGYEDQGEEFTGNIKTRRPDKGGGSVSGKLWNNDERSIPGKDYSSQTMISRYSGNLKAKRPEKGGGSVSGKLWNNHETPIIVRAPKVKEGGNYTGELKISRNHYSRNPKSADGALRGEKASPASLKADTYARGTRRTWDYIKNPSSDDAAQRTREPGRAFAKAGDFQGNIKIKKFDLFGKSDLHPDARFVKLNKNNVPEEKDMLTNFKLWWARLFRKSENQPDHLKEKGRTPRYDKGESGLWYE